MNTGSEECPMVIDSNDEDSSSDSDLEELSPPGSPRQQKAATSNIQNSDEGWGEAEVVDDERAALIEELERRSRARLMHVPTDDREVGKALRNIGAPFCLFGEGPAERRDRLKTLLSQVKQDQLPSAVEEGGDHADAVLQASVEEETWFHHGSEALEKARHYIFHFSIPHARDRLKRERLEPSDPTQVNAIRQEVASKLRRCQLQTSQNADTRPISCVRFSPQGDHIATASWSSNVHVWSSELGTSHLLRGHSGQVDSVAWHPQATLSQQPNMLNLASCGRDGAVLLWSLESNESIASLPKAGGRVPDLAFHPSGRFVAVVVDDDTWRLWDIHTQEEVLIQEGHSKAVSCISMQRDGALAVTGSMDAYGRVWDLRSGRCVMFLAGHQSGLLAVDWSPDGFKLASASQDNTVRVWDIRQRCHLLTLPAHNNMVTGVRFDPCHGRYLATCSYDGTVKLWPTQTCQVLRTLEGHGQKVTSVDIAPDGFTIASGSFDKTYKIWGPD